MNHLLVNLVAQRRLLPLLAAAIALIFILLAWNIYQARERSPRGVMVDLIAAINERDVADLRRHTNLNQLSNNIVNQLYPQTIRSGSAPHANRFQDTLSPALRQALSNELAAGIPNLVGAGAQDTAHYPFSSSLWQQFVGNENALQAEIDRIKIKDGLAIAQLALTRPDLAHNFKLTLELRQNERNRWQIVAAPDFALALGALHELTQSKNQAAQLALTAQLSQSLAINLQEAGATEHGLQILFQVTNQSEQSISQATLELSHPELPTPLMIPLTIALAPSASHTQSQSLPLSTDLPTTGWQLHPVAITFADGSQLNKSNSLTE